MSKRKTKEDVINELIDIKLVGYHLDDSILYTNIKEPLTLTCSTCGFDVNRYMSEFRRHTKCPICNGGSIKNGNEVEWHLKLKYNHPMYYDKFDWCNFRFKNSTTKGEVGCKICGYIWGMLPLNLTKLRGCPKCAMRRQSLAQLSTLDVFVTNANILHNNRYTYSKCIYVNAKSEVCITCPDCGDFWKTPDKHLQGQGCPNCNRDYSDPTYTHYIYLITCDINNWIYVGRHSTKRKDILNDGYTGSGTYLMEAQDEYGMDHFHKEILHIVDTHTNLKMLENVIVDDEFLVRDDVYNQIRGG